MKSLFGKLIDGGEEFTIPTEDLVNNGIDHLLGQSASITFAQRELYHGFRARVQAARAGQREPANRRLERDGVERRREDGRAAGVAAAPAAADARCAGAGRQQL